LGVPELRFDLQKKASELSRKTFEGKLSRENFPGKTFQGKLSREKGKLEKGAPKAFAGKAECDEHRYPGPPRGPHEVFDRLKLPESQGLQFILSIIGVVTERGYGGIDVSARAMSSPGAPLVELTRGVADWQCEPEEGAACAV
jgi:hypothetical protein